MPERSRSTQFLIRNAQILAGGLKPMLPMDFNKFRMNRSGDQRLRIVNAIAVVCLFLALSLFNSTASYGQGSSGYPRLDYWVAMSEFYEGEFRSAATGFNRTSRIKSPEGEWIDSICHRANCHLRHVSSRGPCCDCILDYFCQALV